MTEKTKPTARRERLTQPISTSDAVRALYETFPYPPRQPGAAGDPYLELIVSYSSKSDGNARAFLDAGCGTGVNVLGGALLYPHFQVFGCDLNRPALAAIRRDAEQFKLKNLEVVEADLLDLHSDFGPPEGFDVIFCTGVIHHTRQPLQILQELSRRLKPQGILRLSVYGSNGREGLYRFVRALRKLQSSEAQTYHERLETGQALMQDLHQEGLTRGQANPALRGPWVDSETADPAEFADRYLHPHDVPYTIPELAKLVKQANLKLLRWFEPRHWDLGSLLPSLKQRKLIPEDPWEQYHIVDELFDRPLFDLYLVGPEFETREYELVDANTPVAVNPQVFLHRISNRGVPLQMSAAVRLGQTELLCPQEGRLLETLGLSALTVTEIGSRLSHLGDATPLSAWLQIAKNLVTREILFLPHPS